MKVIYNRIAEEFIKLEEARDIIYEIDRINEVDWSDYSEMDIEGACDRLNQENIYDCGTCYYIVENDISKEELLKVIHG